MEVAGSGECRMLGQGAGDPAGAEADDVLVPTGCQAGSKSMEGPAITRWASEPSAFMIMTGRSAGSLGKERNAICRPSGDHVGPPKSPVAQGEGSVAVQPMSCCGLDPSAFMTQIPPLPPEPAW